MAVKAEPDYIEQPDQAETPGSVPTRNPCERERGSPHAETLHARDCGGRQWLPHKADFATLPTIAAYPLGLPYTAQSPLRTHVGCRGPTHWRCRKEGAPADGIVQIRGDHED